MADQDFASKRNKILILVIVLLFGAAGTVTVRSMRGPAVKTTPPPQVYYYDLTNGALFPALAETPPIMGPSGEKGAGFGTGVRAYVFSCGACEKETDRFIGYLETTSPEYRAALAAGRNPRQIGQEDSGGTIRVATPEAKDQWVDEISDEGTQITSRAQTKCEGKTPVVCNPP